MRIRELSLLALLTAVAFGGVAPAATYEETVASARKARARGPLPVRDLQVKYDDADVLRFASEDRLLVGSVRLGEMNEPQLGPLVMYDLAGGRELWTVRRRAFGTTYCIVSTEPLIVLRSAVQDKVVLQALDPATGRAKWRLKASADWPCAYDTGQEGLRGLYLLRGSSLSRIAAATGKRDWSAKVLGPRRGEKGRLLVTADSLYAVNSRGVTSVRRSDGTVRWRTEGKLEPPVEAMVSVDEVVVYSAGRAAACRREGGTAGWTWDSPGGTIKLMARSGDLTFAVVHDAEKHTDRIHAINVRNGKTSWSAELDGYVAGPLFFHGNSLYTTVGQHVEVTMGMVNAPVKQLHYSGKRRLVGLSKADGKPRLKVSLVESLQVFGSAGTHRFACQPDLIALRGDKLLVLIEDYGLVAVDPKRKSIAWRQPRERSGMTHRKALFCMQSSGAFLKGGGKSWMAGGAQSFSAPAPSSRLRGTQDNNQSRIADAKRVLSDPHASAADRKSARENIQIAVGSQMAHMKISSSFQRAQAAAGLATSMINAAAAFRAAMYADIQRARVAWHRKGAVGLQVAARQHRQSLAGRYQLSPGDRSFSLVDLESGKRAGVSFSPALGRVWPDLTTAALSPEDKLVATVGIGIDADNYVRSRKSRHVVIPGSSVIVYRISDLKFAATARVTPAAAVKKPVPKRPAPARNVADYVLARNVTGLRAELKRGGSPDARYGGTIPALMLAVGLGHEEMVRLLLAYGADMKCTMGKRTVFDELKTVRDRKKRKAVEKLLKDAAAGKRPANPDKP